MLNVQCARCGSTTPLAQEGCAQCGAALPSQTTYSKDISTTTELDAGQSSQSKPFPTIGPFAGVGAVLGPTLSIFTRNIWLITKLVFVLFAPFEIFRTLTFAPNNQNWQIVVGGGFLGLVCKALIAPSLIYALVTHMRTGVAPSLNESYRWGISRLGKFCVTVGIAWVLQAFGLLLLLIPGIILNLAFELVYPMATLERHGPIEILRRSYNLTKGHRWNILLAGIVISLLTGLITVPLTVVSAAVFLSGLRLWPVQAAVATVIDTASELTTVLSLVIYLSIIQFVETKETMVSDEAS